VHSTHALCTQGELHHLIQEGGGLLTVYRSTHSRWCHSIWEQKIYRCIQDSDLLEWHWTLSLDCINVLVECHCNSQT